MLLTNGIILRHGTESGRGERTRRVERAKLPSFQVALPAHIPAALHLPADSKHVHCTTHPSSSPATHATTYKPTIHLLHLQGCHSFVTVSLQRNINISLPLRPTHARQAHRLNLSLESVFLKVLCQPPPPPNFRRACRSTIHRT